MNNQGKGDFLTVSIALAACIASIISAFSSCQSSQEAIRANKINQRPYIIFELAKNPVGWARSTHALLPYKLINVGAGPALEINRNYVSYLIKNDNSEILVQDCPNEVVDNLLPSQDSPIHMDHINISGFDSSTVKKIKVNIKATYHGDLEIDKQNYYSEVFYELYPKQQGADIIFVVANTKFDYGIANK